MRVRYQTSVATMVQFIVGAILTFLNSAISIISGCVGNSGTDCVSNTFVSLLLVILIVGAYGLLLTIGYIAQEKRSSSLALLLIAAQTFAALIFLFDARQTPMLIDKATNGLSFVIAIWVAYVAFNLYRAKGARIVRSFHKQV
jgi:hypothetical protein